MNFKSINLFLALVFTVAHASATSRVLESDVSATDKTQLHQVRLNIPYGNSSWTDTFSPRGSNPLQFLYTVTSSCSRSPYVNIFVRIASTQKWEQTDYRSPYDYYSGGLIDAIRYDISQPWYTNMDCTFRLYDVNGTNPIPPVTPPLNEKLIGALSYAGGFVQDLSLKINPTFVTRFRVNIPAFCKDVQVLEAHTVTEGVQDKALLVDPNLHIYSVNNGAGTRITNIIAALNGPAATNCTIPIYIYEK